MHLINLNYNFSIILFCLGLYIVFASSDYMKKLFGLSLFQTSILWFYISIGKVSNALPPLLDLSSTQNKIFSNPLPHVLMLTAIVVGIATLSLGFSLIIAMKQENDIG